MSNIELKELIYSLENILKQDKRFKKNGDNKYKKNIKTLYINALQNKNNFIYLKPSCQECPVVQKQECPAVQKPHVVPAKEHAQSMVFANQFCWRCR